MKNGGFSKGINSKRFDTRWGRGDVNSLSFSMGFTHGYATAHGYSWFDHFVVGEWLYPD
jgi:hypothetical protein